MPRHHSSTSALPLCQLFDLLSPAACFTPCPAAYRRNVARREMERLRTALNWELAPVIADFSPAFNAEAPTIFDKVG